jgi:hypothetical protein
MRTIFILILLALAAFAIEVTDLNFSDLQWKETSESKGVTSYRQENHSGSFVAVRGVTTIKAPLPLVLTVLVDNSFENQKKWVPNLKEFTTISANTLLDRELYVHVGLPWPVKDRDFAYSATIDIDSLSGVVTVTYLSTDITTSHKGGVIRGRMKTRFLLTPTADGNTIIELCSIADPKGGIPPFIINIAQRDYSENMLSNVKQSILTSGSIRSVHKDFIGLKQFTSIRPISL